MKTLLRSCVAVTLCLLPLQAQAETGKRFLDIHEVVSPGGIHAWLVEDHSTPVISLEAGFYGAGAVLDTDAKQGMVQLAANTLDEGAGDMDSRTFQKALADHSVDMHFGVGRDHFFASVKTLTRQKDTAFQLLQLALTKPRFDPEPVQRMKDANASRIESSLSDPDWMSARLLNDTIYAGHPYAHNSGGTLTTLKAITADDLRGFVKGHLTRDCLRIAVAGDISEAELKTVLDKVFGALPAKAAAAPAVPDLTVQNPGAIVLYKRNIPQTVIEIAQNGIKRKDPDWQAAQVMDFILGSGGFGSRLMEEVREKRGLTYGIYSGISPLQHASVLSVNTSSRNEKVGEVLALVKAEWTKMRDTDVSAKELADAKSYMIGSMPLALESTDSIAGMMLSLEMDDLPSTYLDTVKDKIAAVSVADVRRVSQRLLTPDKLVTILVGSPANVTPTKTVEKLPNVD